MKKRITIGLAIGGMFILQACTTPGQSNKANEDELLPTDPAQAAAFLARNQAETWLPLSKSSDNEDLFEINTDRVTYSETGLSTVWLRLGWLEPVGLHGNSSQMVTQTLMQLQVRCRDNHYRYLSFYALDKNKNIIDVQETPQAEFAPLNSSAATASMYRIACEINPRLKE